MNKKIKTYATINQKYCVIWVLKVNKNERLNTYD